MSMVPNEILLVQICTLIVILVSFFLSYRLWDRYKNTMLTSSLLVFLYVLSIGITYSAVILLRFPTPESNLVVYTGLLLPTISLGGVGFAPCLGALFSIYLVEPKGKKAWTALVSIIEALYIISLVFSPPAHVEVRPSVYEWIVIDLAAKALYLTAIIAVVPVVLFIAFTLKSTDRRNKIKGIILSVSFAMLAILVTASDGLGAYIPIGIRRILIAVAIVLLYLGFVMPSWLSRILKT